MHGGDEFGIRRGDADVIGGADPVGMAQQVEILVNDSDRGDTSAGPSDIQS